MFAGAALTSSIDADGNYRDPSLILGAENINSSHLPEPIVHHDDPANVGISTDLSENFQLRPHHVGGAHLQQSLSSHSQQATSHVPAHRAIASSGSSGLPSIKGRISRHNSESTGHRTAAAKYVIDANEEPANNNYHNNNAGNSRKEEFSSIPGVIGDEQAAVNNSSTAPLSSADLAIPSATGGDGELKSPRARARWGAIKSHVTEPQAKSSIERVRETPTQQTDDRSNGGTNTNNNNNNTDNNNNNNNNQISGGQDPRKPGDDEESHGEPEPPTPTQLLMESLLSAQADAEATHKMAIASVYIDDAINFHEPSHRIDPLGLWIYKINSSATYRIFILFVIIINCLLSYWEYDPEIKAGLLFGVEEICLLILAFATLLNRFCYPLLMPWPRIQDDLWNWLKILILIICGLDAIVYYNVRYSFRIARLLRVYFVLAYSPDTRSQTIQVLKTIFYIIIPFFMVLYLTFFETVIGILLFHDQSSLAGSTPYFVTLYESYTDIFALNTASNFPDISFPAIKRFGLKAGFYFVLCIIIGLYITLNLLVAYVYSVYRKHAVSGTIRKFIEFRGVALRAAFRALAGSEDGIITPQQWETLYVSVNPSKLSASECLLLARKHLKKVQATGELASPRSGMSLNEMEDENELSKLGRDSHNRAAADENRTKPALIASSTAASDIDLDHFFELSNSFYMKVAREEDIQDFPILTPEARKFESRFEHPYAQYLRAVIITSNCGFFIDNFQTSTDSNGLFYPAWHQAFDSLFLLILLFEVAISVYYLTWRRYWHHKWRRIDFTIILLSFLGKIIIEFIVQPVIHDTTLTVFRAACLFRVIRLLRVPIIITKFRHGMKAVMKILTQLSTLLMFLLSIFYIFAIIGIAIWSGKLKDNPDLIGTDYYNANYQDYINFDDFSHALYTCFHLMAVNNYFVTVNAMVIAQGRIGFAYFLAFYFGVGVTILNLVIAFILESIQHAAQLVDKEEKQKEKKRKKIEEQQMLEDKLNRGESPDPGAASNAKGSNNSSTQNLGGLTERSGVKPQQADRFHATIKMAGAFGMFAKDMKKEAESPVQKQLKNKQSRGESFYGEMSPVKSDLQSERRPRLSVAQSEPVDESESELDEELGMTTEQMASKIKFKRTTRKSMDATASIKSMKSGLVIRQ